MTVAGREVSGWPVDTSGKDGDVLLTDDGAFMTIARAPDVKLVATTTQPVTEIPGLALVDGLARNEERVRDRCQELLFDEAKHPLRTLAGD